MSESADLQSAETEAGLAFLRRTVGRGADAGVGPDTKLSHRPGAIAPASPTVDSDVDTLVLDLAGDLEVTGVLGDGGMGQVLAARQRSLARLVALKRVRPAHATSETEAALLDEGRITGGLEHPNIVPVHALGRGPDGAPVLVMKRIEGVSWRTLLADVEHPLWARLLARTGDRLAANVEILVSVCDALAFAHARDVVHRDVKPENVMLGAFGEVYLVDWGIARRLGSPHAPELVGTPAFMAPEMLDSDTRRISARTDVYLLGGVLHVILTGRPPNAGQTLTEVCASALRGGGAVTFERGVPLALATLCRAALDRDPGKRPAGATAMRAALLEWLRLRAAEDLGRGALRRADEVEQLAAAVSAGTAAPVALERAAIACRVAFADALRAWPDNPEGRAGWLRCRLRLLDHALDGAHVEAAEALLDELTVEGVESGLLAERARRLEACQVERRAFAEAADHGRRMAQALDERTSLRERRWLWAVLLGSTTAVLLLILSRGGLGGITVLETAFFALFVDLALIGAAYVGRRALLANVFNRRVTGVVIWCMTALVFHRFAAAYAGETQVEGVLLTDLWILVGATGVAAFTVQRLLAPIAATFAICALGAGLFPEATLVLFAVAPVFAVVAALWAHGRALRRG
jgi:hypothetical protein